MIILEIPPNPNCDAVEMRVFHDVEPAKPVAQVQLERDQGKPAWYTVTGWTTAGTPCAALAQKVDDSGEGVAFLVYGGDAGLRFRPSDHTTPWRMGQPDQWGESFLIISDINMLQFISTPSQKS